MRKRDDNACGRGDGVRQPPAAPKTGALTISEGERRVVTVLFADVVSSLSYSQQYDDEQFQVLLDSALGAMVDAVEAFGGSVVRLRGDGVLALFGAPKAQEDHAARACLAALQLRDAFAGGIATADAGTGLKVRIGLHTGEAITRSLSTGLSQDYDAVGKAVHIGARAEQLCPPGSILATGAVVALTRGLFEVRELDPQTIRGTEEPHTLFEVVAKAPDRGGAGHIAQQASPFLDREPIIAAFAAMLANPGAHRPPVLRLEGEAGYGKSRLVVELADRASRAGYRVIATKGVSHFCDVPYLGVRTLILQLLGLNDREFADDLYALLQHALGSVETLSTMDRIALRDILGIAGTEEAWETLNPPERGARLREAPVALWRAVMEQDACLLAMEDLHWMDQGSLEVFGRIIATHRDGRFLAIATQRPTRQELPPEIASAPVSRLEALSPQDTRRLITLVSTDPDMPQAAREAIANRSAGVPFYVCELVRSYLAKCAGLQGTEGDLTPVEQEHSEIPLAIEASILTRVDRLPDAAQRIAHMGAVIGVSCDLEILQTASQVPSVDFESAIDQLADAGLLVRTHAPAHRQIAFPHEITRDVLLRTIVTARRRSLHAAVLGAMQRVWGQDASDARRVHSLALHAEAAERWREALEYLARACRQAVKNSSAEEAVRLYDRARHAISRLGDQDCRAKEADLHLLVFGAYLTLGRIEEMKEALGAAVDIATSLGDKRRLGLATAQLANAQWMAGEHVAATRSARLVLQLAEQAGSLPLLISAEFGLANALHGQGQLGEAIAGHERVIERLVGLGLEDQQLGWVGLPSVMSRAFLSWFLIEAGRFDDARRQISRGCAVADAAKQPYSQVLIHAGEGLYHLRRGYPEHAVPILDRTLRMCQRVYTMEAMLAGWLGTALVELGRPAEALAITEESFRRQAHLAGGKYTWFYLFKAIGEAHAALGQAGEALAWADKAIDVTQEAKEILHLAQGLACRAGLRLALSLPAEATVDDLEQAREIGAQHGLEPLVAECDLLLARACERLGRNRAARHFASRAAQAFRTMHLDRYLAKAEALAA